ncbi:MAG: hypothetical protein NT047_03125 [Deltaproteobacteria bacterium]|nr:hypothetical protein [Deltaproteobacteria bacterium]
MKRSQWTVLCALALLLFSAMPVGAFEIGVRGYYWFPGFKTDMKSDSAGLTGSDINLKDNLDIGTKAFPSVEVFGGLGKHHLGLTYTPIAYSGSTRLAIPINFSGKTFAAGTDVDSDLKLRMLDLEYRFTALNMENILAGFSLDVIGQIKYIDGEAKIFAPATGMEGKESIQLPIPMVGVGAHIGLLLNILEARAKITGIGYSGNYLYEALADLSFTPFPLLDIHAGYKVIRVHLDRNDLYLNSEFAGPFVALTVSF